ncbi:Microsomal glutathione S-transferase 1 [Eumeta japonica]|uniref:Microsomal glutathione S-transferase 1 n=1 Tax=Eumeta variegata TaxID=151549 RepID=A0A4C1YTT7_EUMVA|nr:Microsomal glutathione S-transferase 1 [Eumeta japonica]
MASISLDSPVVQSYIFYSAILALKLLTLATLTSMRRMSKGVFSNPEDVALKSKGKVKLDDPDVERVRRAHLNDLENIPAFWVLGALYASTAPAAAWATLLFRAYAAGRVLHTLVYAVKPLPQPARALAYLVPYAIMWYMGIQVILHYRTAL